MITELKWHDVEEAPEIKTGTFLVYLVFGMCNSTIQYNRYSTAIYQGKCDKKTKEGYHVPEWIIDIYMQGCNYQIFKWAYLDQGEK